jgi:hypothetical protein
MSRLDEIERTANLGTDCGYFIGEFAFHDILALVAVARAVREVRRHPAVFHNQDAQDALYRLDAALAPLLAEKEG